MEFVKPEAFAVAYKSRYVAKPVEAAAAMQATFDKRYEDAVGYGDIIKQTVAAAKPETTAQLAEVTRIATEAQAKLQAAIDSGDVRNVDLEAKRIATDFASDPRISIIARSAEMIRKQDEERQTQEMRGESYLKITDESRNNFLGYTPNEDGSLNAQKVPTFYAKKLDWDKAANMKLNAGSIEELRVKAVGGNPAATAVLNAAITLSSTTTGGISAKQIETASVAYAPVFLGTAEGAQYISAVRSGQTAPVGVSPNQEKKLADYTDEQLAELYLIKVNAPQIFESVSREYQSYNTGTGTGAPEDKNPYKPGTTDFNSMASRNNFYTKGAVRALVDDAILMWQFPGIRTPKGNTATSPSLGDAQKNGLAGLQHFQKIITGKDYVIADQLEDIHNNRNNITVAMGIDQFSDNKAGVDLRKDINSSRFSFRGSQPIWTQANSNWIGVNTDNHLLTSVAVQALIKSQGNAEVIGRARPGNNLAFYGGDYIKTGKGLEYVAIPDVSMTRNPDIKLEALSGAIQNAYSQGSQGLIPMITYPSVDGKKLIVSVSPYASAGGGEGGKIVISHGTDTVTLNTSLLTPENISRVLEAHYVKNGIWSWGK